MSGTLYAVGIGPGDPELLTLKAARLIREARVLCVPRGKEDGESLALSIVSRVADISTKKLLDVHFPMKKGSVRESLMPAARDVLSELGSGNDVVFITLGDPVLYSTFYHLYDALAVLDPKVRTEVVPGVSSVNAAAARAGINLALADDRVAIVPAPYMSELGGMAREFDTIVIMKASRNMDAIREMLIEHEMLDRAIFVSRVGLEGETVKRVSEVSEDDLNYFSIVIVKPEHKEGLK